MRLLIDKKGPSRVCGRYNDKGLVTRAVKFLVVYGFMGCHLEIILWKTPKLLN